MNYENSGTTSAIFTVSLSPASGQTVTVNFATEQTQEDVALPDSQTARPLPTQGAGWLNSQQCRGTA